MKWIVAILFLANVGLAVYFNSDALTGKQAIKPSAEIKPEQLVLLSQQALEAKPKRQPAQTAVAQQE